MILIGKQTGTLCPLTQELIAHRFWDNDELIEIFSLFLTDRSCAGFYTTWLRILSCNRIQLAKYVFPNSSWLRNRDSGTFLQDFLKKIVKNKTIFLLQGEKFLISGGGKVPNAFNLKILPGKTRFAYQGHFDEGQLTSPWRRVEKIKISRTGQN